MTPARSATISPTAAISNGVAAETTIIRMSTIACAFMTGRPRPREEHAIARQHVGREHADQQHALKGQRQIAGQMHRDLRVLAADERQGQHQPGDEDADRRQAAEKGDDDRGEAVARRDRRQQLADLAGHFDDAGEPGQRARNHEGGDRDALVVEAAEARRARRRAGQAHGIAEQGLGKDQRRDGDRDRARTARPDATSRRRRAAAGSPRDRN